MAYQPSEHGIASEIARGGKASKGRQAASQQACHVGRVGVQEGVVRLENPKLGPAGKGRKQRKALLHVPSVAGQVVSSYASLERMLAGLGWDWERYYDGDGDMLRYHKRGYVDLIRLPKNVARFGSVHMHDIVVVKNPDAFSVIDA